MCYIKFKMEICMSTTINCSNEYFIKQERTQQARHMDCIYLIYSNEDSELG